MEKNVLSNIECASSSTELYFCQDVVSTWKHNTRSIPIILLTFSDLKASNIRGKLKRIKPENILEAIFL